MTPRAAFFRAPMQGRAPERGKAMDDQCPVCHRRMSLTKYGRIRRHRDKAKRDCPGSNIYRTAPTPLAELPPVVIKPLAKRTARSDFCSACGRTVPLNNDGTLKAHRPEADVFAGPRCPGGRPVGPDVPA